MEWMNIEAIVMHRPLGFLNFHRIPSSALTDPRRDSDWIRLCELQIHLRCEKAAIAGVATNARELRALLENMQGKRKVAPPYHIAKRIEEEQAGLPSLRRSIHFDEKLGKETKDPAELIEPYAAKPLA